jgi:Mg2+-importing ATPase
MQERRDLPLTNSKKDPTGPDRYWQGSAEDLLAALGTSAGGLRQQEASKRLLRTPSTRMQTGRRASVPLLLLAQFKSPIILILIGASLVSLYFADYLTAGIILGIVFLSGLLGFFQEYSASNALVNLLKVVKISSTALRDGQPVSIANEEIVPGDVLLFSAGAMIPADCRLLEANHLHVEEAMLTGETLPVDKDPAPVSLDQPGLGQMSNILFMGTHIRTGSAKAVVVRTGRSTQFGQIAEHLRLRPPQTEFERGTTRFGYFLLEVTLSLVFLIFVFNVIFHRPVLDSLLFSLALAVGLVPQLLPAIITVNLAKGAQAMAKKKVIIKRLAAIENFGSMEILCTDKTGTLTEGLVQLQSCLDPMGQPSERVRFFGYLNAKLETGIRNPIDEAICNSGSPDISAFTKLDEVPYDFVRKRLSVVVKDSAGQVQLVCKGALNNILDACATVEVEGHQDPIDAHRPQLEQLYVQWSGQGLRILGVAIRSLGPQQRFESTDEREMTFLGFLLLLDPPKADAREALARLENAGVRIKLITGDNRLVSAYIAQQVGLSSPQVITGERMRTISDEALIAVVRDTNIFAEIEPNQKERIIGALRKAGFVVGYLGDGINDAPALHMADVGISVNTAVDVAKDAAEIVLLESGLGILADGVTEGRRTFANTIKYIFMATSANFGNMFSMAGASLLLPFLPLLPTQILLTNFLTDFPELTIATDRVDPEMVDLPRRWDIRFIRRFMVYFGLLSSVFDYATFGILLLLLQADPVLFRTGWFVESVLSASLIVLVVRTRRPFYRSRASPYLIGATALIAIAVIVLPYSGPLARLFQLTPLPWSFWPILVGILVAYAFCAELVKRWFYRAPVPRR